MAKTVKIVKIKNKQAEALKYLLSLSGISLDSLKNLAEGLAEKQLAESNEIVKQSTECALEAKRIYDAQLKEIDAVRDVALADVREKQAVAANLYQAAWTTKRHLTKLKG